MQHLTAPAQFYRLRSDLRSEQPASKQLRALLRNATKRILSRVKRYFVRILPEITAGPANAERSTSEEESILEKFGKVKHTTAWTERGALLPASNPTCRTPKPQILDFASRQENKNRLRKKSRAAPPCLVVQLRPSRLRYKGNMRKQHGRALLAAANHSIYILVFIRIIRQTERHPAAPPTWRALATQTDHA